MGFNNPQNLKGMLGVSTQLTDIFLQVKLNGDLALLKAIELFLWLEEEKAPGSVFDQAFIEKIQQVIPPSSNTCNRSPFPTCQKPVASLSNRSEKPPPP